MGEKETFENPERQFITLLRTRGHKKKNIVKDAFSNKDEKNVES